MSWLTMAFLSPCGRRTMMERVPQIAWRQGRQQCFARSCSRQKTPRYGVLPCLSTVRQHLCPVLWSAGFALIFHPPPLTCVQGRMGCLARFLAPALGAVARCCLSPRMLVLAARQQCLKLARILEGFIIRPWRKPLKVMGSDMIPRPLLKGLWTMTKSPFAVPLTMSMTVRGYT